MQIQPCVENHMCRLPHVESTTCETAKCVACHMEALKLAAKLDGDVAVESAT